MRERERAACAFYLESGPHDMMTSLSTVKTHSTCWNFIIHLGHHTPELNVKIRVDCDHKQHGIFHTLK